MAFILVSGIFIRFSDYTREGYDVDAQNVLAAATYWYYPPYKFFPAMIYQEPPLGDMIIGVGCMASGEDFSGVREVTPLYFPDRPVLFGKACANAEKYCFFPIYFFGAIFLILIAIISTIIFNRFSALFLTTFFAYSPIIIKWSRLIHVDIIFWVFLVSGLLFLWLGYAAQQNSKKERIYFLLSFALIGFSGATKFTAGLYFIFAPLLFIEKYKSELKIYLGKLSKELGLNFFTKFANQRINIKALKTFIYSIITLTLAFLLPFKLNPKNFIEIYNVFTTQNRPGAGQMDFSWDFFRGMYYFIANMNIFETLILIFSIFMFFCIILKKRKTLFEKFIIYLLILQFIAMTLFEELVLGINGIFRSVPFMFGFMFLMALSFSKKPYSLIKIFKLKKKTVYILLIIYILFSAYGTYSAPNFQRTNSLICYFDQNICEKQLGIAGQAKATANYLKETMQEGEYFFHGDIDPTIYFYINPQGSIDTWNIILFSEKNFGRRPTLAEYQSYFQQIDKPLRYILLFKDSVSIDREEFKEKYSPNHIVKVDGNEVSYVYDLENLIEK